MAHSLPYRIKNNGGTDREHKAVIIFDAETKVAAIFDNQTNDKNIITTCQLTREEELDLKQNHNFGGNKNELSGQAKNLPPKHTKSINKFKTQIDSTQSINNSQITNDTNEL